MNIFFTILIGIVISVIAAFSTTSHVFTQLASNKLKNNQTVIEKIGENQPEVLAATDENVTVSFNIESIFNKPLIVKDKITAPNIVYSIRPGSGIKVEGGQNPVITNTGITSLSAGSGITIDGNKITNSGITSLSAGTGISVSGSTITNTLTPDYTLSGWTRTGTTLAPTTTSDIVNVPGTLTLGGGASISSGGLNMNSSGITNAGSITGATGFTSSGTITLASLSTGIVHSNFNGVLSSSPIDLSSGDVTETLPIARGGTGLTSYTLGDIPYASASNTLGKVGIGATGQVLTVSGGIPSWGTVTGSGGICTDCLVSNPGTTQTIIPSSATAIGLVIKQANSGSVDIFKVTDYAGTTAYLRVDSAGNVLLGNGQTTNGIFTVSPTGTHPISVSPSVASGTTYTGIITSSDLSAARTWTLPNTSGILCTDQGNCAGNIGSIGGSGTANYLTKWSNTYGLGNSILYDNGSQVGIGTTSLSHVLEVLGTANVSGALTAGSTLGVTGATTLSSTLNVTGTTNFSSTLGVTGTTTLSSTLGVTGSTTVGGNFMVNGAGSHYFSAGSVGIGTTTPGSALDVKGTLRLSGATSGYVGFAPAAAAGSTTYTLPSADGASGQILSTNGSGTLSWATAAGGSLPSGTNGQTIYYNNTTATTTSNLFNNGTLIGIGTTTPTGKLHVSGGNGGNASVIIDQTNTTGDILTASSSGTTKMSLNNVGTLAINSSQTYSVGTPTGATGAQGFGGTYSWWGGGIGNVESVRVYAYKTLPDSTKVFSTGYSEGTVAFTSGANKSVTWTWNAVSGASGYRLIKYDEYLDDPSGYITYNWDYFVDTTSTTFLDTGPSLFAAGNTVTPANTTLRSTSATFTDNVGIGTTQFGTNAAAVLSIANSTAPTAAITNGIQLYAVDVTGSHELKVMDEAGNATTLSPHNFSLISDGPSEALAWSYYSERDGLAINADMTKALRILENISGEQLIHLEDLKTGLELGNDYLAIASDSAVIKETQTSLLSRFDSLVESMKSSITSIFGYFTEIFSDKSHQKELCIGEKDNETCIKKDQLDELIKLLPSPIPTTAPTGAPEPTSEPTSEPTMEIIAPTTEPNLSPTPTVNPTETPIATDSPGITP